MLADAEALALLLLGAASAFAWCCAVPYQSQASVVGMYGGGTGNVELDQGSL